MSAAGTLGRAWDEASSPAAARLARRFEEDWRRTPSDGSRPDPADYLPDDSDAVDGAWLALLRVELSLHHEGSERFRVEDLRAQHPSLNDEIWVGVLYEEYCLREEAGETPRVEEYVRRFPDLASRIRRVLDIHELVGAGDSLGSTASMSATRAEGPPLPDRGQTIGGFRLVEELGRGTFARVFRAEERQLADRPVALKVARAGSREPQTLASLQHTHIVPVHSYRTDPATGLHLLCMPYFGRVTLAMILADPALRSARMGSDLLSVLDRLESVEPVLAGRRSAGAQAIRRELSRRSYAGAIAWWGARLAEALDHAHERGVLHRDLKPSNVLVTADGLPMLLDFNLARASRATSVDSPPTKLGGTLAYMAPEHLEALADGLDTAVDARSDIFALGVVLHEALCGTRPFGVPREARSIPDALLRAAEERRRARIEPRRNGLPVHPALQAVLRRCLAADPSERYESAGELAADLRAVADDAPLPFAAEPFGSRAVRWARRNRRSCAWAAPLLLTVAVVAASLHDHRITRIRDEERVRSLLQEGAALADEGNLALAIERYASAKQLVDDRPELSAELASQARDKVGVSRETLEWRRKADALLAAADPLKSRLLGFAGDQTPDRAVAELLKPFFVLERPDWTDGEYMTLLESEQRRRLVDEVHLLLFLWIAQDRLRWHSKAPADDPAVARWRVPCARVLDELAEGDPVQGPWQALAAELGMLDSVAEPDPRGDLLVDRSWAGASSRSRASAAFLWGVYHGFEARVHPDGEHRELALTWLELACREQPDNYWARFFLAPFSTALGRLDAALEHADVVVALRPDSPWSRFNRAEAFRARGDYERARLDLELAERWLDETDRPQLADRVRLNLGVVRQALGDPIGARALYDRIIADGTDPRFTQSARLNRAGLDAASDRKNHARAEYDALIREDAGLSAAYLGRARLALAEGRPAAAEADLTALIEANPRDRGRDDWLAFRSRARLLDGRSAGALADAEAAEAGRPGVAHQRLVLRARLADRRAGAIRLEDPAALDLLPLSGPWLASDARAVAAALTDPHAGGSEVNAAPRLLTQAVLLAATGDPRAEAVLERAIACAPDATAPRHVRARLRLRSGRFDEARREVDEALALEPDEPRLLTLRGLVRVDQGDPSGALEDLDRALSLGVDDAALRRARARALGALGRPRSALVEWGQAMARDPSDPSLPLDRARLLFALGAPEFAYQDLETAVSWAAERPDLLAPVVLTYLIESQRDRPDADSRWRRAIEVLGQFRLLTYRFWRGASPGERITPGSQVAPTRLGASRESGRAPGPSSDRAGGG